MTKPRPRLNRPTFMALRHQRNRTPLIAALVLTCAASVAQAQTLDPLNLHLSPQTSGQSTSIKAVVVQPDGKFLIGGWFNAIGTGCGETPCPAVRSNIARLNPDGSLDVNFNPGPVNTFVYDMALQPDGKILVGGAFTTIGGVARPYLARLNANGTIDQAFDSGANGSVVAIAVQPDGRILLGGTFTSLGAGASAQPRSGIGRLLPDGALDVDFNPGSTGGVNAFAVQADGKILVGGRFTMLGGGGTGNTPRARIGRLNSDGTVDSFNPSIGGTDGVFAIAVQADGKIIVGGLFDTAAGLARQGLVRLTASGAGDPSLNANLGYWLPVANVSELAVQTDGKIIVGGLFDGFGGQVRPSIGRMNGNGTPDLAFKTPGISNDDIEIGAAAIDSEGRLLVGGGFTISNGDARDKFARFTNSSAAVQSVSVSPDGSVVTWSRGGSSREVDYVTFESTTDGATWTMLGQGARIQGGWQLTGQALSSAVAVRARGFARAAIYEGMYLAPSGNLLRNAGFDDGTFAWSPYATPDSSYIVSSVNNGVFEFYRVAPPPGTENQAVLLQETGIQVPAGTSMTAQFDLGNSDSEWKRLGVLIHDREFRDLAVCTVWLAPNAPMRTYSMTTRATQAMPNVTISFYAASIGSSGGAYQLDNVSLRQIPGTPGDRTQCFDPTTPASTGTTGPDLIVNGNFASEVLAPNWSTFGQIQAQVTSGVAQFVRPAGTPAGVLLQATGQPIAAGDILTATFDLGNSTEIRRRVLIVLHDLDFSDLSACSFWLEPGQPLAAYSMRMFTTRPWANATFSIYSGHIGPEQWIQLDNVTLRSTPDQAIVGTECLESTSEAPPTDFGIASETTVAGPSAGRVLSPSEITLLELAGRATTALMRSSAWLIWNYRIDVQVQEPDGEWLTVLTLVTPEDWTSLATKLAPFADEVIRFRTPAFR